jgi:hypothetical protein
MKPQTWQTLLVSAGAGVVVWALSPWLAGQREPWDAEGFYYVGALVVAGVAAGLLTPRPFWAHYLGALIGQLVYAILVLGVSPLLIVGAVFLLGYTLIFLVGAVVAAQMRGLVRERPLQK